VVLVDTTGAGDCFNAGFIKAWLDQRPLEECLKWGNIVGGLSTLALGGTGQVTTVKEVEEWLAKV
jgi:sugar/nucleoside kinase (ribokinase family)